MYDQQPRSFFNSNGQSSNRLGFGQQNFNDSRNLTNSKVRSEYRIVYGRNENGIENKTGFFGNQNNDQQNNQRSAFFGNNNQSQNNRGSFFNNNKENNDYHQDNNQNFGFMNRQGNSGTSGFFNQDNQFQSSMNENNINGFQNNQNQQNRSFGFNNKSSFFNSSQNQNNQDGAFHRKSKIQKQAMFQTNDQNQNRNNQGFFPSNNQQSYQSQISGFFGNKNNINSNNQQVPNNNNQNSFFANQNNQQQLTNTNQNGFINNTNQNQNGFFGNQNKSNNGQMRSGFFGDSNQTNQGFFGKNNQQQTNQNQNGFFNGQQNSNNQSQNNNTNNWYSSNSFFNNQNNNNSTQNQQHNMNQNQGFFGNQNQNNQNMFSNNLQQPQIGLQFQNQYQQTPVNNSLTGQVLYQTPSQLSIIIQNPDNSQIGLNSLQNGLVLPKNQNKDVSFNLQTKNEFKNKYQDIFESMKYQKQIMDRQLQESIQRRQKQLVKKFNQMKSKSSNQQQKKRKFGPYGLSNHNKNGDNTQEKSETNGNFFRPSQTNELSFNNQSNLFGAQQSLTNKENFDQQQTLLEFKKDEKEQENLKIDLIFADVCFKIRDFEFDITKSVYNFKEKIFNAFIKHKIDDQAFFEIEFIYKNKILYNDKQILKNVLKNNDEAFQIVIPFNFHKKKYPRTSIQDQQEQEPKNKSNFQISQQKKLIQTRDFKILSSEYYNKHTQIVAEDLIPKIKNGYQIEPNIIEISRMNLEQLQKVQNFKIKNKFGEIQFEEPVDLTGVNLDQDVKIQHKSVEVYPGDIYKKNQKEKPLKGEKLNKKCKISLYDFKPLHKDSQKNLRILIKNCQKQDLEFVNYDQDNFIFTFRSFSF